jgi:mannose-1-phosphate guanylyltransferase
LPGSTKSSTTDNALWAVVLAGGVGSRFWPVSTPARPKQLLPLAGDAPLIRQTIDRIEALVPPERIRILTGERLGAPILDALPAFGPAQLLIEPMAKGTAPVLAWAAHGIASAQPGAVMVSLHADHVIEPASALRDLMSALAASPWIDERLFTIGARPSRPETGYGYIRPAGRLDGSLDAYAVERFVEKPERSVAEQYMRDGYLWNTGIFAWKASTLLDEIREHTPEIATLLPLLDDGDVDAFFDRCPPLTIDVGVLERSDRVAVVPAPFDWDDVGTWDALGRSRPPDAHGNVAVGNASFVESTGCVAWAEGGDVVVFGAHGLIVVRSRGITFVAPRDRAADLKTLLNELPERLTRLDGD